MNKWVKRTVLGLLAVAVLAAATALTGKLLADGKLSRRIIVNVAPLPIPTDAGSIAQGGYLFNTRGCAECHGANGAGKTVISDGDMLVVAPNITKGANSVTTPYKSEDWVRTIRHGVKPSGNPVLIMPSEDYNRLTDQDTAALIAYVSQLPPVAGAEPVMQLPAPVKMLYGLGLIQDAAEKINHRLPPASPVPVAVSAQHGAYVANACIGCHGPHLSGGTIPGTPPTWPPAANLTPGEHSAMARYPTADAFMAMLKSGKRPDGTAISKVMPFNALAQMSDTDVRALYAYLKTVPPREAGRR